MKGPTSLALNLLCFLVLFDLAYCNIMQTKKFEEGSLNSNVIATSKYILVGQAGNDRPVLKKLNLQTTTIETITLDPIEGWDGRKAIVLADFQNGQIGFAQGDHFFILNNETLEIKSIIDGEVNDFKFYTDLQTGKSKIFLGKGHLYWELLKDENGKYYYVPKFWTFQNTAKLTLTDFNKAVYVS